MDTADTSPVVTPTNPPGLDALAYRLGTRPGFVEVMERALGADPVLRRLGTREPTEPIVALVDAGASMLDVLTFYQERIANEGFLRTAIERRSVLELVRAIGYELRPGVAASTMLAFTVTKPPAVVAPDAPVIAQAVTTAAVVRIPVGTKAQSVPGQDELPRTFETVEEIEARPEWNAMRVRVTVLRAPQPTETDIYLAGTATNLSTGDVLLLVGFPPSEVWEVRRVRAVRTVPRDGAIAEHTIVTVDEPLEKHAETIYAMRTRAPLFGHNAMPWDTLPVSLRVGEFEPNTDGHFIIGPYANRELSWADAPFAEDNPFLYLDRVHPEIVVGGWVVLQTPEHTARFELVQVVDVGIADFGLAAQVTRLGVLGPDIHDFSPRNAAVFAKPELLPLGERPVDKGVFGREIDLADPVEGLTPGRFVAIRGIREDTLTPASEVRQLAEVWVPTDGTVTLVLTEDLKYCYVPNSVRINANVAPATEGDTRTEILGNGDATRVFQEFTLTGKPLTHVSAPTPSGGKSTLRIRVDGVLWTEVASFFGQSPKATVYIARLADDGTVTVRFGDGRTGAVLPTGQDNIVATYRVGTGRGGNLDQGRISLLLTRPLGVEEVINPIAATGGEDPEQLAKAKQNAPATVLTLDRIVSLRDYEDFARSFAGIGKARASAQWNGEQRIVRLVVAAEDGAPVDPSSALFTNLRDGIDAARHPGHQVVIDPFHPRPFLVALGVTVTPDRLASDVFAAVTASLTETFSFERRDFGQRVAASEVLATVQAVPGVRGAVLTALHFTETPAQRVELLPAEAADLLTLAGVDLTELLEPLP